MLLGFTEHVDGLATGFVRQILASLITTQPELLRGPDFDYYEAELAQAYSNLNVAKIHTLREDALGRWAPGRVIHFATGVRTPNLKRFALATCTGVQRVVMRIGSTAGLMVSVLPDEDRGIPHVLTDEELVTFARNDGFATLDTFRAWFEPKVRAAGGRKQYRLIHWTDFRYQYPQHLYRKPSAYES